jgi:hypothetical protein
VHKIRIIACLVAATLGIYLGIVFYSRWSDKQALIQRLEATVAQRDHALVEAYEGGIKILAFYAVPSTIRRGETAQLCYGAASAESVRIEPAPAEPVWPSQSRCVGIMPQANTTYRFIAQDGRGKAKTADLTVTVH